MRRKAEREFFRMAGFAFACRWRVMGHVIEDDPYGASAWPLYLVGQLDQFSEMQEIIEEEKRNGSESVRR